PRLVDRENLLAASAAMHQTFQWARIASPAIAAAVVARLSENACFLADAVSFAISALLLTAIPSNVPRAPVDGTHSDHSMTRILRDVRSGIAYLFADPELSFAVLAMAAGSFATTCYSSLVGVFVRDALHSGMRMYGTLGSLIAVGMLIGGLI